MISQPDAVRAAILVARCWSSVDRLDQVDVPVLLLAGRNDAFCAWPQSERIARRLPDAETVIFDHSGHVPWLDEPDAFLDAVVDWLHRRARRNR